MSTQLYYRVSRLMARPRFPLPPTNVTASVSGSDIVISWTAAKSVDGYYVYQSIDGGTWTKLNATATTDLTYTLTPTEFGEYNFRVTSVRGTKESTPSAEAGVVTAADAWYDPSDISTLFLDAEGTTPMATDGDPVGLMLDKSGNGNHASQDVSANMRPVYKTDGSKSWLLIDPEDDELLMPPIYGDEDNFVFSIAVRLQLPSRVNARYFGMVRGGFNLQCGYINDGTLFTRVAGVSYNTIQKITLGQVYVIQHIRQGGVSSIRVNGQAAGFNTGTLPSSDSTLSNSGSLGGGYTVGGYKAAGEIYGAIYHHGSITEVQLVAMENYLANKAGGTL